MPLDLLHNDINATESSGPLHCIVKHLHYQGPVTVTVMTYSPFETSSIRPHKYAFSHFLFFHQARPRCAL